MEEEYVACWKEMFEKVDKAQIIPSVVFKFSLSLLYIHIKFVTGAVI